MFVAESLMLSASNYTPADTRLYSTILNSTILYLLYSNLLYSTVLYYTVIYYDYNHPRGNQDEWWWNEDDWWGWQVSKTDDLVEGSDYKFNNYSLSNT